jgi:hypothetical protein
VLLDEKGFCKKISVLKACFKNKSDKDKPSEGSGCRMEVLSDVNSKWWLEFIGVY